MKIICIIALICLLTGCSGSSRQEAMAMNGKFVCTMDGKAVRVDYRLGDIFWLTFMPDADRLCVKT